MMQLDLENLDNQELAELLSMLEGMEDRLDILRKECIKDEKINK